MPKSMWKTPRLQTNHACRTSRHTCRPRMAGSTRQTRRHNHTYRLDVSCQIFAQTKTRTYPELTTKIIDSAFGLSQMAA